MNYVLFSAIGDTDPIRDGYDGAMLHIVRHYKPIKVYLFFTKEMEERDRKTDCYAKAVKYLIPNCEISKTYSGIENPSDFDAFYRPFEEILNRIIEENPQSEILLNVSSATPQIKFALCLEAISRHNPMIPLQVSAPRKGTNKDVPHFNWESDIEYEMREYLFDNSNDEPKRVKPLNLVGCNRNIIKRQIKALIGSWDYKGAYELIKENARLFNERLNLLLEHAYYRSLPDEKEAERAAKTLKIDNELYPVKNNAAKNVCEYFLVAELRRKRGELTDFILRVTALIEHLLREDVGNMLGGLNTIASEKKNGGWRLERKKLENNHLELSEELDKLFPNGYRDDSQLGTYILGQIVTIQGISDYDILLKVIEKRNISAHELDSITEAILKQIGTNSRELSLDLKAIIKRIYGNHVKSSVFDVFEYMNEMISKELDNHNKSM